jgi:hypothetical protein
MRIPICLLFVFISAIAVSQEKPAAQKNKLGANVTFSLNSNGIASIPAFSLDKPALVASVNLTKGRFSYDPTLAYSLELKPWYIDNWLHYKIILRPKFELRAGMNISTFCSGYKTGDEEFMRAERYFAFAMAGTYKFTPSSSLTLDYWSDNGQEKGSLSGHFINLEYDRYDMQIGGKALLSAYLMLFYINYDGDNDGLFFSPRISMSLRGIPSSLFFQATQPIQSNISPWPGFRWNVGISYNL